MFFKLLDFIKEHMTPIIYIVTKFVTICRYCFNLLDPFRFRLKSGEHYNKSQAKRIRQCGTKTKWRSISGLIFCAVWQLWNSQLSFLHRISMSMLFYTKVINPYTKHLTFRCNKEEKRKQLTISRCVAHQSRFNGGI